MSSAYVSGLGVWLPDTIRTNDAWPAEFRARSEGTSGTSDRSFVDIPVHTSDHAGAVSAAALAARGEIDVQTAIWAAAASLGTNTLVKIILAAVAGGPTFAWAFALRIVPAATAFGIVAALL